MKEYNRKQNAKESKKGRKEFFEDMIRFAVWGIGVRGKSAVRDLGDKVVCIIENNDQYYNTCYEEIPIVSCDEYIESYSEYPVIITPFGYEDSIRQTLCERGVNSSFIYYDCQDLIKAFALQIPIDNYVKNFDSDNKIIVYRDEMLGCLLYNYLWERKLLERAQIVSSEQMEACDILKVKMLYEEYYKAIMLNLSDYYYNPKLEQFRDIYHGRRCFVIATGSSLRIEDLNKLYRNKEICFSLNGIFPAFSNTEWRPDYYVVVDLKAVMQWKKEIVEEEIKAKFIAVWAEPELSMDNNTPKENIYTWYAFKERMGKEKLYFSENFARGTSTGWTVTYSVLQLAVYMGFSEIYLLGADCNYTKGSRTNHFHEDKEHDVMDHNVEGMIWSYQAAEEYARSHGIKIYNATRGGMLEVFERVDFDSLFEEEEENIL